MNTVNDSKVLQNLVNASAIVAGFGSILEAEPVKFPISFFRAQFPWMDRSIYTWHQDMGTWYGSKVSWLARFRPVTLWFSLNGANASNSLDIAIKSDNDQLHAHSHVSDQGAFKAMLDFEPEEKFEIFIPECDEDEGVFFSDLCLHRSRRGAGMKPRYSVDIRYFDPGIQSCPKVPFSFRLKRGYQMLLG